MSPISRNWRLHSVQLANLCATLFASYDKAKSRRHYSLLADSSLPNKEGYRYCTLSLGGEEVLGERGAAESDCFSLDCCLSERRRRAARTMTSCASSL